MMVAGQDACVAPDWAVAEVANALAAKVLYEGLPIEAAEIGISRMPEFLLPLVPSLQLIAPALRLSYELKHAVYDCIYLALAIRDGIKLITADKKFIQSVARGNLSRHVDLLDWPETQ